MYTQNRRSRAERTAKSLAIASALILSSCKGTTDVPVTENMDSDKSCKTEIAADGAVVSACEYGLSINGVKSGHTRSDFRLEGARGSGGAVSATTTFVGTMTGPGGGVFQVRLSDDGGYELDAGSDGRLQVKPTEIDPADPEAAVDGVTVVLTSKTGLTKVHTVTCPGLFAFAAEVEEAGQEPAHDTGCPEALSEPNQETGCFPCESLAALIAGHSLYNDPEVRTRTVITGNYAADLYQKHGGGERAAVVVPVISLIAVIVAAAFSKQVNCKTNFGPTSDVDVDCGFQF